AAWHDGVVPRSPRSERVPRRFPWCRMSEAAPLGVALAASVGRGGELVDAGLRERLPQLRVAAAAREQLLVGALLDDPAAIDNEDPAGGAGGGEPVRDQDRRPPLGDDPHGALHAGFGGEVE